MFIIKRNGTKQEFDSSKIDKAILSALKSSGCNTEINQPSKYITVDNGEICEIIQNQIEN